LGRVKRSQSRIIIFKRLSVSMDGFSISDVWEILADHCGVLV
jgi:hypothetical protein